MVFAATYLAEGSLWRVQVESGRALIYQGFGCKSYAYVVEYSREFDEEQWEIFRNYDVLHCGFSVLAGISTKLIVA